MKVDIRSGMHTGESFEGIKSLLCGCDFNSVWNKVIRRDLFASDDWYSERVGLMHGEDLCQLLPVFDKAKSLFHIDEPLYYYRQHDTNSTKLFKEEQVIDWSFVSDELIRYASEWSLDSIQNANRGICRHYCDLDEVLWHSEVDKEAKRQFDKIIKNEYHRRISNCPDLVHNLVLSNYSIVSFAARQVLSCFKCVRRLFV